MLPGVAQAKAWWEQRAEANHSRKLRKMLGRLQWCVADVGAADENLVVTGWALAPEGDHARVEFRINDLLFDDVKYPLQRPSVGKVFSYIPGASNCGFECKISRRRIPGGAEADLELTLRDCKAKHGTDRYLDSYYPGQGREQVALPDPLRMRRVQGTDWAPLFRLVGFTAFVNMERALRKRFGKSYGAFSRVLDWGCGCGRVTRYFARYPEVHVTGVDIDPDNVGWCRKNMPFAQFHVTPLHPPTDLPAASFDLIFGISVFTHLKENEQFLWLDELRRLAAPGAVLLMSIHGQNAVCYSHSHLGPKSIRQLSKSGFFDNGICELPGVELAEADYYRGTYHTQRYIQKRWSKYFEILEILPGYIGGLQDLVVMRRR